MTTVVVPIDRSFSRVILWRRLDRPGHEAACLERGDPNWHLNGTVIVEDGGRPCRLDYAVVCDAEWRTLWTRVSGWIGLTPINHRVSRSPSGQWHHNGLEVPSVAGCIDVDLAFSPSTNLLPIRRLGLAIGASSPVKTAWLRFPEFTLEPLDQVYHRETDSRYRYESRGGEFRATLEVADTGLVLRYGDLWLAEATFQPGT
jgi:hypothetical protein